MKTTITRLSCALLILIMILSCTITAFAASVTFGTDNDGIEHNYVAYKIFKASTEYNGVLTDIDWADDIDDDTIIELLSTNSYFANVLSIDDVLTILTNNEEDYLVAFADIVGDYAIENGTKITDFDNLEPGYYVFVDVSETTGQNAVDAKSRFVLKVSSNNLYIPVKSDKPTVEKYIVENDQEVKLNSAAIGDEIHYKIESNVPNMTGYDKYFFIFHDTMSKGLTFQNNVVIKLYGKELQPGEKPIYDKASEKFLNENKIGDYYVETVDNEDGTTSITIVFLNMLQYITQYNDEIIIEYSAILNENAVIDNPGNPNEVYLEYSNDPTHNYIPDDTDKDNKPDEGKNVPTGETVISKVKTFTTGIEISKVDGDTKSALTGALFEIEGYTLNKIRVTGIWFIEDEDGTYWQLKDGSYTATDPTTEGIDIDMYVDPSGATRYKRIDGTEEKADSINHTFTAYVDYEGKLVLEGLAPGHYTIKEIKAPDGYNLLKEPISIDIIATYDMETNDFLGFSAYRDGRNISLNENTHFQIDIENHKGSTLPETGGFGRFFLVGIGIISMFAGAGVITIYSKKRNNVVTK